MAILVNGKSIQGSKKENFSVTVYDGEPTQVRLNVYELPFEYFEIDYINSEREVVRTRFKKSNSVMPEEPIPFTSEMKQDTIRAAFEAKYIDQRRGF